MQSRTMKILVRVLMGTDDLYHKRKRKAETYARRSRNLQPKDHILIVCEGEKTEPNYFLSFPVNKTLVNVKVSGEGRNTRSLVKQAEKLAKEAKDNGEPYDQVWCVFDKDDFSCDNFNAAINICERKPKFNAAYSNEAFELWYLLHYEYHDTAHSRDRYKEMLTDRLGETYKKNSEEMYEKLLNKQEQAIKNAEKLYSMHDHNSPALNNPCTTVFKLVQELNKFLRK